MKNKLVIAVIFILVLSLSACGSAANKQTGETAGEGGVEAALVNYTSADQGFTIGHPSTWTQDTSFTDGVKFVGGDDWMTLQFVTPSNGTDVMSYAKNDATLLNKSFTGYQQINLTASTEVKNAVVLGFSADGTSTITGKSFKAHNERYYIGQADGRIAVLTVVGPDNHYDREGVRDIALTLKSGK